MQSDNAAGPEDDPEIVDLELAEPDAVSEVDPAAIFTLTIVGFVLTAVAIAQQPRGDMQGSLHDYVQSPEERSLQTDSDQPASANAALVPRDILTQYLSRPVVVTRYPKTQSRNKRASKRTNDPFAQPEFQNLPLTEKLQRSLTLQRRASIQVIVQMITRKTGIPIHIHIQDLRADGITKLRVVDINASQQSIEAILCETMRQGNPERTESVDERFQCLVYVIAPDGESLILTSRRKAEHRGTLPDAFKLAR